MKIIFVIWIFIYVINIYYTEGALIAVGELESCFNNGTVRWRSVISKLASLFTNFRDKFIKEMEIVSDGFFLFPQYCTGRLGLCTEDCSHLGARKQPPLPNRITKFQPRMRGFP